MGTRREAATALLLAGMLGGCGHAAFQPAVPADRTITLTPASGESGTANVTLRNLGNAWRVEVTGQGLRTTGTYALYLINNPSGVREGVGQPPFSLAVSSGKIDEIGTAARLPATSLGVLVTYNPSGNPRDTAGAQPAFTGAFPAPLR